MSEYLAKSAIKQTLEEKEKKLEDIETQVI